MNILLLICVSILFLVAIYAMIVNKIDYGLAIFIIAGISLLMGFRDIKLVPDTMVYSQYFHQLPNNYFEQGFRAYTIGFKWIFGENIVLYFMSFPIINSFLIGFASRKIFGGSSSKILYSILFSIYFSFFGLLYNAVVLRAGVSMACLFVVYAFVLEKKFIKAALFFLIAVSFHFSAFIGLFVVLLLICKIRFRRSGYITLNIVTGILFLLSATPILDFLRAETVGLILKQFPDLYKQHYLLDLLQADVTFSFKFFFFFLISIAMTLVRTNNKNFYYFLSGYNVGLITWILFGNTRISDYLVILGVWMIYIFITTTKLSLYKVVFYASFIVCNVVLVTRIINVNI